MKYNSLENFLKSNELSIDKNYIDDWGTSALMRGREIEATILFTDISSFTKRTKKLNPTETLMFVNMFFNMFLSQQLINGFGIVDKYIGDEIMIIFSEKFGSSDPLADALNIAKLFTDNDVYNFCSHSGIAKGNVIIGFVGSSIRYDCSAFGHPVNNASICKGERSKKKDSTKKHYSSIVLPYEIWDETYFDKIFNFKKDGNNSDWTHTKGYNKEIGDIVIIEKQVKVEPPFSLENWIKEKLSEIQDNDNKIQY